MNSDSNTSKNIVFNVYLIFISIIAVLPILAPVVLKIGLETPAKLIYFIYSFFCHQFSTRSLHIFDYQYAWCARDTGIWIGLLIGSVLTRVGFVKHIKWYILFLFVIPIAIDGGYQTITTFLELFVNPFDINPVYLSNNFTRFLTGFIFGFGLGCWISNILISDKAYSNNVFKRRLNNKSINSNLLNKASDFRFKLQNLLNKNLTRITLSILFGMLIYLFLVQIWSFSSSSYLPTNFVDSIPKRNEQFFLRRERAICPTNILEDFIELDCFFSNS